ncbi:glycerol kinase GlpK [Sphingomonas arenae]|uniref:glycerol kinase GlpK n=1 Tax=Sphingomonas arenae TaxID=2812555 RepID=UPI001967F4E2|nr:glycerol kinase GlpK [Sphingomonas arenae]
MPADHLLAIDQGTTSTRAMIFDSQARAIVTAQREFPQHYPALGWVEHDPEDIWRDTLAVCREALDRSGVPLNRIAGIGITNQRETAILWDRATGEPVHPAIVWQDRRTADTCAALKADGAEELVRARTGLLLDPYFSATKLAWMLDHIPGARERAERGELAFGTVDSFLLWRLTGGRVHATDATNAARTLLFDIHRQQWDEELCHLFRVPVSLLPDVRDNSGIFGMAAAGHFGRELPIAGMAGDQQAALIGQACFAPGMAKATYGTGCFLLLNTGETAVTSANRLLTTPAYRLDGKVTYAVEGSIFVAGAAIKWLRDGLGVIVRASDTDSLATQVPDSHGVTLVPAFVGLGAPYWDPDARAAIHGLTLDATAAHLARAALESVAFQTHDLFTAMIADGSARPAALRVDGGMAANGWLCQFLADLLDCPVERPGNLETTALGAAFLAGMATGVWSGIDDVARTWAARDRFVPAMGEDRRAALLSRWQDAVRRTIGRASL